jgi:4-amino-4-deoxy-L-arabinose transferase-like glycosyltransferase
MAKRAYRVGTRFRDRGSWLVWIVLTFALVSRLGTFWIVVCGNDPSRAVASDTASYDESARALLRTGRFAVRPERPDLPQTIRTPGYPAFLATVYALFGERHEPAVAVQVLVSVGTIALAYGVACRVFGRRAAGVAAVLLALDPDSFVFSQLLLTETLFTFVLLVAVASGVRLLSSERPHKGWAALLGVALAVCTLIRPINYYLVFAILLGLLALAGLPGARDNRSWFLSVGPNGSRTASWGWKGTLIVLVLVAVPSVVLVGGWQVRNYVVSDSWEFSHIRGGNLLFYRGADIVARRDGITLDQARERISAALPNTAGWPSAAVYALHAREGTALIRKHPWLFVRGELRGLLEMTLVPGEGSLLRYLGVSPEKEGPMGDLVRVWTSPDLSPSGYVRKWLVERPILFAAFLCALLYLCFLYSGLLISVGSFGKRCLQQGRCALPVAHLFIAGIVVYLAILSAGPEAYSRFRVPIMPLLALYSGAGMGAISARLSRPGRDLTVGSRGVCRKKCKNDV